MIEAKDVPTRVARGSSFSAGLGVKNTSKVPWPARGSDGYQLRVAVAYHWWKDGKAAIWDGERTPLPRDLFPAESVAVSARVKAPADPGRYQLELDLIQEGVSWFKDHHCATVELPVEVF